MLFLRSTDINFFSGLEIYFKALEIYFSALEIYFKAFEIVLFRADNDYVAGGKGFRHLRRMILCADKRDV